MDNYDAILTANGYAPHTTPLDTLMGAPARVGLSIAEDMDNHDDGGTTFIEDGFQEWDPEREAAENASYQVGLPC